MITLHLQPIYNRRYSLLAYEALARMPISQASTGFIIKSLETNENPSYIRELQEFVINKVVQYCQIGYSPIWFNFSSRCLFDEYHIDYIIKTVEQSQVEPHLIGIEITETYMLDNMVTFIDSLKKLRNHGFCLVLDDFGQGYESLKRFVSFDFDYVKLSGEFIKICLTNERSVKILAELVKIVDLCQAKAIAEYVESMSEFHILYELGFAGFQGYWLSKPQPVIANDRKPMIQFPQTLLEQIRSIEWPV